MNPQPPAFIWADFDPHAPRGHKWAFYRTKAEQKANRPDLKPVRLHVFHLEPATRLSEEEFRIIGEVDAEILKLEAAK